jgi:hypothetical protein
MGVATSTSEKAGIFVVDKAQANAGFSTSVGGVNTDIIHILDPNPTTTIADITSFNSDGFTLSWTVNTGNPYVIHYIAFADTIISNATVNSFTIPTSGATINVTNAGFQPDFVMLMTGGPVNGSWSVGAATSASSEWTTSGVSIGGGNDSTDICTTQRTNASIFYISDGGSGRTCADTTHQTVADFTQFTANGFDLNVSNNPDVFALTVYYLALEGKDTSFNVGSFNKPTSTGSSSVNNTGFKPAGILFFSRALATSATIDESASDFGVFTMGATSGFSQEGAFGVTGAEAEDAYTPAIRSLINKTIVSIETDSATVTGEANLRSFDSNGFTLNWTTADANADEYLYWGIGEILDPPDLMRHGKWFHDGEEQPFAF